MFKFLKEKLKKAVSSFSTKVDEGAKEDSIEEPIEEVIKKTLETKNSSIPFKEVIKKVSNKEIIKEMVVPENTEATKKGFFSKLTQKITTKTLSKKHFETIFLDLEMILLENSVAVEVIEKIKQDLVKEIVDKPVSRTKIEKTIIKTLEQSINDLFIELPKDILRLSEEKKPFIICLVGTNGSGKTTTIAKLTRMFLDNKKSVVLAAADTFRAAAIDQLQLHADKLGVKLIKHDYGADAAAVTYDAIQHAKAKSVDIVLIDTAGRLHSNSNLVDEMKKLVRIAKPDMNIFIGESITGNDCVEQAKKFDNAIGLDGIILSKADIDEKGGAAISISYVTKKPILYLGTGQDYKDLEKFNSSKIVEQLFN